ncbi:type II and III secretion system protein family protein [Herbaspirillum sp. HC18]|nr:type II and III secretion system protein family protein [Herbaspirillum sp. HC18]
MNRNRNQASREKPAKLAAQGLILAAGLAAAASIHASQAYPAPERAEPARAVRAQGKPVDMPTAGKPGAQPVAAPVCSGEIDTSASVSVSSGKSRLLDLPQLKLPAPAWLRSVGDPEIVQVEPLTSAAPRNMFFAFGKKVGATNLMFQNKDGRCAMVEVNVAVDTASVQSSLLELLPSEKNIRVSAAADSLVLSGTVSDATAVDRAVNIANAFIRKSAAAGGTGIAQDRIVNMISVGAPQQVMLEVKVAEISKSLLDRLGMGVSAQTSRGGWMLGLLSNFNTGGNGGLRLQKGNDIFQLDAETRNGLVKILAEPTVMAISGQEGSFLAGGRIFIPVAQDVNGKVTLEEKEFGVGLRFMPTVLDGGRINLRVSPEVSELSREGVGISSSSTGSSAVLPLISTRRAATTVQLFDGQSFAIGGLIKYNVTQNIKAFPVLGEVPVLGSLFRSNDFQSDKTELVFIVTPRLVKPLPANYPLPTDAFVEPSRSEFFVEGRMESKEPPPALPATGFELK